MKSKIYVSQACVGRCAICQEKHDLRAGVCFHCCNRVRGQALPLLREHMLWQDTNPDNVWYVPFSELPA